MLISGLKGLNGTVGPCADILCMVEHVNAVAQFIHCSIFISLSFYTHI